MRLHLLVASAAVLGAAFGLARPAVAVPWPEAPGVTAGDSRRADLPATRAHSRFRPGIDGEHPPHVRGDDQHGGAAGHLPATSLNVEVVGKLRVADAGAGRIADVAAKGDYAYLGAFSEPTCRRGGTYVVRIRDPRRPRQVNFLESPEGSYVGEGVQVLTLDTPSFKGDVLINNNEICDQTKTAAVGGISLWDVTRPTKATPLAIGVGDRSNADGTTAQVAHQVHSAFMWTTGEKAYVGLVDDEEPLDVDILDITNPREPTLVAETGLAQWPSAQSPLANGVEPMFHDVVVRKFGDTWTMLLSYWDAGWITLNVNDPTNPVFMDDSDYDRPDPLTGFDIPEGNAHQAEWDRTGEFIITTDEDFSPYRTAFEVVDGPAAGPYPSGEFGFARPIAALPGQRLSGPTVYGGYGCDAHRGDIPSPSILGSVAAGEEAIVVFSRGPVQDPNDPAAACTFVEKIENARRAGYGAAIIANHHVGALAGAAPDAAVCGTGDPVNLPALCIGHRVLHRLFGREPEYTVPYPVGDPGDTEPNAGDKGARVTATARFDGWGYVHLLDATTLEPIDALAIREALDERYATGYGALSVHEVATDPDTDLAYLSYYAGGLRVLRYGEDGLREVGRFIDEGGNDFWGVEVLKHRDGQKYVLASDRDSGLYIFRYTGN